MQGTAGSQTITVTVANVSQAASGSFTYNASLTPQISGLSPTTTTVTGELGLSFQQHYSNVRLLLEDSFDYVCARNWRMGVLLNVNRNPICPCFCCL